MGREARIRKELAGLRIQSERPVEDTYHRALEALKAGNRAAAIVLLQQTVLDNPTHARAHFNLALVLREQVRLADAIEHFKKAIALDPRYTTAFANLGETLRRARRFPEALAACEQAIAIDPRHAEAYLFRAVVRHDLGDLNATLADLEQSIALDPKSATTRKVLGKVLMGAERKHEALAALEASGQLDPTDGEVFRFIGDLCDQLGRLSDGFGAYRRAIEINQADAFAYANLSGLLCKTKMLDLALSVTDVAIKLSPNLSGLYFNRAIALEKLDRIEEAVLAYADALRVEPDSGRALISVCRLRSQLCDWEGLAASEGLARTLTYKKGKPTPPFGVLLISPSLTEILSANRVWSRTLDFKQPPLAPYAPRPAHRRHERLRIGYLSADFHLHATAALIAEHFELHDKSRFETWGYSIGAHDEGSMRQRLVDALDHFQDLSDLSHDAAAERIRDDEIDILIDLKGYTFQARAEILVRRPAPIQVNFLGYPGTMGARFIDYVIGDPVVTPMEHAPYYTEQIVQLPHSYQPNDRRRPFAPVTPTRADCGLPADAFVFCCFNANHKITPAIFDIWMRLLRDVPGSVLWLYQGNDTVPGNLRREAAGRGVDPARLVFAPKLTVREHLSRIALGDLFLDTSPYGAHTTASEALWAGLPVLTYRGEAFPARVGASLVEAVGLPEMVTTSLDDYEALARRLATQPGELAAVRAKLGVSVTTHPLFDTPRYTRAFENALTRMAEIRDAGEAPKAFAVTD